MEDTVDYPPDVFELLVSTIPLLSRSKEGVVLFLLDAGVDESDLSDVSRALEVNPDEISKFEIVRRVLARVSARGDAGLQARREIIRQVTEFESFDSCWPTDQSRARTFVGAVREAVNAKDLLTRMKQEHDLEREQRIARQREQHATAVARRAKIEDLQSRLSVLIETADEPQDDGRLIEPILGDLFRTYNIQIREDFTRRDPDSGLVLAQVDGAIELDGIVHLVELKWLKEPLGPADFSPQLGRLMSRPDVSGIFLSMSGYTESVIRECAKALDRRMLFLCSLQEISRLLLRQDDLIRFLKRKSRAAIVDRNPYLEILG